MTFAYADPPYIGMAHLYPENQEVDHAELIERLCREYPDGWALSLHSPSLKQILALCPDDVRVGAWVKPFCVFKPHVRVAYAWEPIIFRGGRKRPHDRGTVRDWVEANSSLKGRGFIGAKPDRFSVWLFEVLGMDPEDELHDLFPGTGAVARAWEVYREQLRLRNGLDQPDLQLT